MKKIKIERIADLFDEKTCEWLLSNVRRGECHRNAVLAACALKNTEKKVKYVEGYIDDCGHVINSIERNGETHYFDVTQEWLSKNNPKRKFFDEFDVIYEQFGTIIIAKVRKERCARFYKVKQFGWEDKYHKAA